MEVEDGGSSCGQRSTNQYDQKQTHRYGKRRLNNVGQESEENYNSLLLFRFNIFNAIEEATSAPPMFNKLTNKIFYALTSARTSHHQCILNSHNSPKWTLRQGCQGKLQGVIFTNGLIFHVVSKKIFSNIHFF